MTQRMADHFEEDSGVLINTAKTVGIILLAIIVGWLMSSNSFNRQIMIMVYLLIVFVISAITPGYVYGILTAISSAFIYDFTTAEPRMLLAMFIMLPVTVATSAVTTHIKVRALNAFKREQRAQQLYEINKQLLAARDVNTISALTVEYMTDHLRRCVILYTKETSGSEIKHYESPDSSDNRTAIFHTQDQRECVSRLFSSGANEDTYECSHEKVFYITVANKNKVLGVIGIDASDRPISPSDFTFVHMLSGQVALALEIQFLSDEQSRILVEAEIEKTRATLLRSISHDLRTPLTSILGASSALLEQKDLDPAIEEELISDIKADAQWLIRMVENILIITRITGDQLKVKKVPEAAEEVISSAVSIVRKRFPSRSIQVHIPDELVMAPMDATLISQVLINLLENAVKNSPNDSLISVELEESEGSAVFRVIDSGYGLPEVLLGRLFEAHSASGDKSGDASRGMGIGLSICKTIVHAHGGFIEGHNRVTQGAEFSFGLPVHERIMTDE